MKGGRSASKVAMQTRLCSRWSSVAVCCAIATLTALDSIAADEGELFWNAIGLIRRARDGRRGLPIHEADGPMESERAARLLRDPGFLYETFYRSGFAHLFTQNGIHL